MDNMRYQAELTVIARKFPANAYRFFGVGTDCPYLRIGARTNSGKRERLDEDLPLRPRLLDPGRLYLQGLREVPAVAGDVRGASPHRVSD